jgi:hypothetical protein
VWQGAEPGQQLEAVHRRHPDAEESEIGLELLRRSERRLPIRESAHLEPLAAQAVLDH